MRMLHAVILAAGEGTRMKSGVPKVLHAICGRPMIAYALDLAASAGIKQPIVVLGRAAALVKPVLPTEARVAIQATPLGTADAMLAAKKAVGASGSVLILYADTPLLRRTTVQKLIETHFKTGATCTLLTAHLADPSGYGRIQRNEHGQVIGVIEESEAGAAQGAIREINVGPLVCQVQGLWEALAAIKPGATRHELYLTQAVAHLARQEGAKIQTARVEEVSEALGINARNELARAIGVIRQRLIDAHLHNGVTIEDPQTTVIDHGVTIGVDTVIHPSTVIETGVAIGKRCSIGPFARLRSGVMVGDEVRIGNFAELVRTKVGSRVRINHVSYLGDATVEDDVNIGAGAITANYDGKNKYPTTIGKGAFIGSDTVLIAPVKVGPSAVTGAGSVVPKAHDVPAHGVVVGVPARPLAQRPVPGGAQAGGLTPKAAKAGVAAETDGRRRPPMPSQRQARQDGAARTASARSVRPRPAARPRRLASHQARKDSAARRIRAAKHRRVMSEAQSKTLGSRNA